MPAAASQNGITTSNKRKRPSTKPQMASKKVRHQLDQANQDGEDATEAALGSTAEVYRESGLLAVKRHGSISEAVVDDGGQHGPEDASPPAWRLSEPMGGWMANIDPIFTRDEKHLIIVYGTSLQVCSTADSLLVRRIPLPSRAKADNSFDAGHVVAAILSPISPEIVWVGCSDGRILRVNWTTGSTELSSIYGDVLKDMTIQARQIGREKVEILFTSELAPEVKGKSPPLLLYLGSALPKRKCVRLPCHTALEHLRSVEDGRFLVGWSGPTLVVGRLESDKVNSFYDLKYQFYSVDISDGITSLDARVTPRVGSGTSTKASSSLPLLNLAVGCERGSHLHLRRCSRSAGRPWGRQVCGKGRSSPRKYSWHRRAVQSLKWSRDGNYIISGGLETVLVLHQADTGKLDFLPHLGAAIENIVVSPRGSSYAIHLDDNSTMVLSTADMKPTTYVSGLQYSMLRQTSAKASKLQRIWTPARTGPGLLPAIVHPVYPWRLLLGVGASLTGSQPSTSSLQTFDLSSFQSVSKQPLARTHPTDSAFNREGLYVTEPAVTHLCLSHDAKWLASVDVWEPPGRDSSSFIGEPVSVSWEAWSRERREVYLKFWEAGKGDAPFELVSRVNEPHFTRHVEPIFALVADRKTNRFVTVGDDAVVRFWGFKRRQQDGLTITGHDGRALVNWSCTLAIPLGESSRSEDDEGSVDSAGMTARNGALCFSEDASTLFVAFGRRDEGLLYVVDSASGEIRNTIHGMFRGGIRGIQSLSSCLIMLSDDLKVLDVVADELRYGVRLTSNLLLAAYLAVSERAGVFAVAICSRKKNEAASEVAVFSPDRNQPLLVETFPNSIVSLLPAIASSGFIAIDCAAQIWSLAEATDTTLLAQPLADLNLDIWPGQQADEADPMVLGATGAEESDDEPEDETAGSEAEEDYDVHEAIIAPQRLADIFDAAPAFAMPPIEELFYQVAGLISSKPIAVSSG